jgi:ATP-dependent helicase/nuclease subunit A
MSPTTTLPRELVLASAGTGKTFRISSRVIGLLAAGAPADSILASTFTRKAAGEILDRVLARLADGAVNPAAAAELRKHAALHSGHEPPATCEGWLEVLVRLVRELHRANIGTLDAFFVRTAGAFAEELGLPAGWRIGRAPELASLHGDALEEVLDHSDAAMVLELLRGEANGEVRRSVHARLLDRVEALLRIRHEIDGDVEAAWDSFDGVEMDGAEFAARRAALGAALSAVPVPRGKNGKPNQHWVNALRRAVEQVEAGDWEGLLSQTLCAAAREDGGEFSKHPVPPGVSALFREACALARIALARKLAVRSRALARLSILLAEALERRQRLSGAYDFGDLTRLISEDGAISGREDAGYRLDVRTGHVLLDEFQDTSLSQWRALEPLLDRVLRADPGAAAIVVADPKQSIYGWRGGEPVLVGHAGERFALAPDHLDRSWRSSQVVLDFVNRVFTGLPANGAITKDPGFVAGADAWSEGFRPHTAQRDLPGYVRVEIGPQDEGRGGTRPELCRHVAALMREIRQRGPGRSIGILTRTNRMAARILYELRVLGVDASGEGGSPLTDSAAVAAILALLRLAEHPADSVAAYHVARSPVGAAVGLPDHLDRTRVAAVAQEIRSGLVERGYGTVLAEIADRVADACDARDRRRVAQLVDLALRYDAEATLRIRDFLALVESERVDDPSAAAVRVMTIHQSKGLEFDVVVLPELHASLAKFDDMFLVHRPDPADPVERAFPPVPEGVVSLFDDLPELGEARRAAVRARVRDGFSALYVALTRARYALHLVLCPDGDSVSKAKSAAMVVRHALGAPELAAPGGVLFEDGEPDWHARRVEQERAERGAAAAAVPTVAPDPRPIVALRRSSGSRVHASRTPSQLAGGASVDVRMLLNLDRTAAGEGTLVHAWLEAVEWIDDGLPDDAELARIAERVQPGIPADRVEHLASRLRAWLEAPAIRDELTRSGYAGPARVEREVPFIHPDGGTLLEGIIDRLVIEERDGLAVRAVIIDYKTDAVDPDAEPGALDRKAEHYAPQMDGYRRAVAAGLRLQPEAVTARLVFLAAGEVVAV